MAGPRHAGFAPPRALGYKSSAKAMLPFKFEVAFNVALVAVAIVMRLRSRPRRALRRLAIAYGALLGASSFVATGLGVLVALDPFAGETFDPSREALTALGVPQAASYAATGVMAFLLPTIAALVMFRMLPARPAVDDPQT